MLHPPCRLRFPAFLAVLLVSLPLAAQEPAIADREGLPVVSWQETRQAVRKEAIVYGHVVDVGGTNNIQFLNFSRTDRNAFKVVVFARSWPKFPKPLPELYRDKLVEVRGHVTLFEGNPQIVVSRPEQIQVVEQLPETYLPKTPESDRAVGDQLTLATFNIENLFDGIDDAYTNDESTPEKPRAALKSLAATIASLDADVLALQEVENRGYLQRFANVFLADQGYQYVVLVEGNDSRGIDVALLSRFPLGPVTSHAYQRFDPDVGGQATDRFQRDLLCVEVRPPGSDSFEVWVVHLKSKGGNGASDPIRLAEAQTIRQLVDRRISADPQASLAICGDFNDEIGSPSLRAILGQGDRRMASLFDSVPESDRVTFNQEPYRSMIDFILCSPAMARRYVPGSYRIQQGSAETNGSDHNPVSCKFLLHATAAEIASRGTGTRTSLARAESAPAPAPARPASTPRANGWRWGTILFLVGAAVGFAAGRLAQGSKVPSGSPCGHFNRNPGPPAD